MRGIAQCHCLMSTQELTCAFHAAIMQLEVVNVDHEICESLDTVNLSRHISSEPDPVSQIFTLLCRVVRCT